MNRSFRVFGAKVGALLAAVTLASCAGDDGGENDGEVQAVKNELSLPCTSPLCQRFRFVDLRPHQTGFRDQGGRDTCTVFATTAAVEAAYKRIYGLDLDLSEQFLNHVQKSFWLDTSLLLPGIEIQPETNGGGNVPWQFGVLRRYGLPLESELPYIGAASWEQIGNWTSPTLAQILVQRGLDDFLLSATPVTYYTPAPITATVLPQAALEGARYRPTTTRQASAADLTNLAWFQGELSAGREVAFDVGLTAPDPTPTNGVWDPGPGWLGYHAMLMVGFSDARQAFLVKNSWANTDFDYFSYSWVTNGSVVGAASIVDVADPYAAFGSSNNPHLFLGRWNLDHDGWKGTLDLYRLPGDGTPAAPDRRMGTYFGPDGIARRVNGTIAGNRIDFYIDWNVPDQPGTALQGMHFTGYLYAGEHGVIAGSMLDNRDGNTWAFTATKGPPPVGVAGASAIGIDAYWGIWDLDTDGAHGTLMLTPSTLPNAITGTFRTPSGVLRPISGTVQADPRFFLLAIDTTTYTGYLNGHELGLATGSALGPGGTVGFNAVRTGAAPFLPLCSLPFPPPPCP